jgi:hypothetical protein
MNFQYKVCADSTIRLVPSLPCPIAAVPRRELVPCCTSSFAFVVFSPIWFLRIHGAMGARYFPFMVKPVGRFHGHNFVVIVATLIKRGTDGSHGAEYNSNNVVKRFPHLECTGKGLELAQRETCPRPASECTIPQSRPLYKPVHPPHPCRCHLYGIRMGSN